MGPELETSLNAAVPVADLPLYPPSYEPSRRRARPVRSTSKCTGEQMSSNPGKGKRRAEARQVRQTCPSPWISREPHSRSSQSVSTMNTAGILPAATAAARSAPASQPSVVDNRCSRLKRTQNQLEQPATAILKRMCWSSRSSSMTTGRRGAGGTGNTRAPSSPPAIESSRTSGTRRTRVTAARAETTTASSNEITSESDAPATSSPYNRKPQRAAAAVAAARLSSTCSGGGSSDEEVQDDGRWEHGNRKHVGSGSGHARARGFSATSRHSGRAGGASASADSALDTGRKRESHPPRGGTSLEDVWTALGAEYFQDPFVVQDLLSSLIANNGGNVPSFFDQGAAPGPSLAMTIPVQKSNDRWWRRDGISQDKLAKTPCNPDGVSQGSAPGEVAGNRDSSRQVNDHRSSLKSGGVRGWECPGTTRLDKKTGRSGRTVTRYCWEAVRRPGQGASANRCHFVGVRVNKLGVQKPRNSMAPFRQVSRTAGLNGTLHAAGATGAHDGVSIGNGENNISTSSSLRGNGLECMSPAAAQAAECPPKRDRGRHRESISCAGGATSRGKSSPNYGPSRRAGETPVEVAVASTEMTASRGCSAPPTTPSLGLAVRRSSRLTENQNSTQFQASVTPTPASSTVVQCVRAADDSVVTDSISVASPIGASVARTTRALRRSKSAGFMSPTAKSPCEGKTATMSDTCQTRFPPQTDTPGKLGKGVKKGEPMATMAVPSTIAAARERQKKATAMAAVCSRTSRGSAGSSVHVSPEEPRHADSPCAAESPRSARRRARSRGKEAATEVPKATEELKMAERTKGARIGRGTGTEALEAPETSGVLISTSSLSDPKESPEESRDRGSDGSRRRGCDKLTTREGTVVSVAKKRAEARFDSEDILPSPLITPQEESVRSIAQGASRIRAGSNGSHAHSLSPVRMEGFPRQICSGQQPIDEVSQRLAAISEALYLMEQIAILPSLRRVVNAVQVDVGKRGEEQAKNAAAVRIERAWRAAGNVRSPQRRSAGRRSRSASCCTLPFSLSNEGDNFASYQTKRGRHSDGGVVRTSHARGSRRRPGDEEWSPSSNQARSRGRPPQAKQKQIQSRNGEQRPRPARRMQPPMISESSSASSDVECGGVDDSPLGSSRTAHAVRRDAPSTITHLRKRSVGDSRPVSALSKGQGTQLPGDVRTWQSREGWEGRGRTSKRARCRGQRQLMASPPAFRRRNEGHSRMPEASTCQRSSASETLKKSPIYPSTDSSDHDASSDLERGIRRSHRSSYPSVGSASPTGGEDSDETVSTTSAAAAASTGRVHSRMMPKGALVPDGGEDSESYSSSSYSNSASNSSSPGTASGYASSRSSRRHGERGQSEDGSKRHSCREWDCQRRAHFGTPGWVPAHCGEHRRDWEVFLKYASCLGEGCEDRPAFGVPGDRSRVYCRRHRVSGAVTLASAGWKVPEGSRFVGGAGGWVEAEEDGMGMPVDSEAEEDLMEDTHTAGVMDALASVSKAEQDAAATPVVAERMGTPSRDADMTEASNTSVEKGTSGSVESAPSVASEASPEAEPSGCGGKSGGDCRGTGEAKTERAVKTASIEKKSGARGGTRTTPGGLVVIEKNKRRAERRRARALKEFEAMSPESQTEKSASESDGGSGEDDEEEYWSSSDEEDNLSDSEGEEYEDIVDDPVFAPGRFAFLVPSKICDRPILVGKIVLAVAASPTPPARPSPPPPLTIPVSSATALLLAKAAALGVTPAPVSAPVAPEVKPAAPEKDGDEKRWIYVHWHTPASLRRGDYCRGPFTPDFVKKEGSKSGGWAPFVTKIRKASVVVTSPGLLASRCIPAEALRELGV